MKKMINGNLTVFIKPVLLILFLQLCGCALFPPPPAQCNGQFRPINAPVEKVEAANKPVTDSNAGNQSGEADRAPQNGEGVTDGK